MSSVFKEEEKEGWKVMEISELNKGYLLNIFATDEKRVVTRNDKLAFSEYEQKEMIEVILSELKIKLKVSEYVESDE